MPDLDFEHDDDYFTVWALADTGYAAHVADKERHCPGAVVRKPKAQRQGVKYVGANGGEMENKGEFDVVFEGADHKLRKATFQNADVGLPYVPSTA